MSKLRVAIYARVSTKDKGQDPINQILALREWIVANGHQKVEEYIDYETGSHSNRPAFKRLHEDAARHRFDMVLVWAFDRYSREGLRASIFHLQRLTNAGVAFRSHTEEHLQDDTLGGNLCLALRAEIAREERRKISERTKAGLARTARENGKFPGRPKVPDEIKHAVRASQASYRAIAEEFGIGIASVSRIKAEQ